MFCMFPLLLGFANIYQTNILALAFPEVKAPGPLAPGRECSPGPGPAGILVFPP